MAEHLFVDQGQPRPSRQQPFSLVTSQLKAAFLMGKIQGKVVNSIAEFLVDREIAGVSEATLQFYTYNLAPFQQYLADGDIDEVEQITPALIRAYLLEQKAHRSSGGLFSLYSALRAFLRWYEAEYSPADWRNPIDRVKAPRRPSEVKAALDLADFEAMLGTCDDGSFESVRDRAMLYFLVDTGVRKQELIDLRIDDIDLQAGSATVWSGKGRKTRIVFFGPLTRKWLGRYMIARDRVAGTLADDLWIKSTGDGLTASGARQMLRRRAEAAKVEVPGFHAFRRTFAINALRSGMDLVTLQRLLGHSSLQVIQQYLPLVADDLQQSHKDHSPLRKFLNK